MIVRESVRVPIPTPFGTFEIRAFEQDDGPVYLAMVHGDIGDGEDVLVRLHSECLTGDALGSLRCDCGVQLRLALRTIAAERRGVLVYATGHEGRGIGLVNKLKAYVAQDGGADTVDANLILGMPVDSRDYTAAATVLELLGIRTVRLLTNNPTKVRGLRTAGATVHDVVPLPTAPHHRNLRYLQHQGDAHGPRAPEPRIRRRRADRWERRERRRPAGRRPERRHAAARRRPSACRPSVRRVEVRPEPRRPDRHGDR